MKKLLLALLPLIPGAALPAAPVTPPDTSAGGVLAAWLDAFNSGDRGRMMQYVQRYDPTTSVDTLVALREQTGEVELQTVLKSTATRIEFIVHERGPDLPAIGKIDVSDAQPARVTHSSLQAAPPGGHIVGFDIDAAERMQVIERSVVELNENYVFPETAHELGRTLRKLAKTAEFGSFSDGDDFAAFLTSHLREVSHDRHLGVRFRPTAAPRVGAAPNLQSQFVKSLERSNCGFEKVERLPQNIGYLKFDQFANPTLCGATASAAMNFLAHSDAVIFDLRHNGGGDPAMIALVATYLFPAPVHLNDIWNRKEGTTTQYWTLPYVPGPRLIDVPVYILTSSYTFSGAEEFSYDLQALHRATVVGETTGGGAHPVSGQRIDDRFVINVPFARAINPVTKTNWEGVGVQPDVKVPAADALMRAQDLAVQRLITVKRGPPSSSP